MMYYFNFLDPATKKVIITEAKKYPDLSITDGEISIRINDYSEDFDICAIFGEIMGRGGERLNLIKQLDGQPSKENVPLLEKIIDRIPSNLHSRGIALKASLRSLVTLGKDHPNAIWEIKPTYTEVPYYE